MGRWGDGLYHSDQALDFFGEHISAILEREIAFWTTPEEVTADTFWLVEVLCTLELMVLFEKQNIGSTAYLEAHAPAVRRWHKIVSEVWNTEWTETDSFLRVFPYHHHDYRVEQRDKIDALFHYLESLAEAWSNAESIRAFDQAHAIPEPLPFFSLTRYTNKAGREAIQTGRLVGRLVESLVRYIVHTLSAENRANALTFSHDLEGVLVAVDVLCLLCRTYALSLDVEVVLVARWQQQVTEIWGSATELFGDKASNLYRQSNLRLEELKVLAERYPPFASSVW
jgi:hypothetical protein